MAFNHHRPGCPNSDQQDPATGDYFCDCHTFSRPQIGPNGSDIAFPVGWTEIQAREWRKKNGLAPPSQPGAGA
jgi:hypothetical protein